MNNFDFDFDYYTDPSEMLQKNGESTKGLIELRILPNLYPSERDLKIILTEVIKHPEMVEVLDDFCAHRIMECKELCDYVNDYTVYELSEMDCVWNTLADVLERSIREYFGY